MSRNGRILKEMLVVFIFVAVWAPTIYLAATYSSYYVVEIFGFNVLGKSVASTLAIVNGILFFFVVWGIASTDSDAVFPSELALWPALCSLGVSSLAYLVLTI